MERIKQALERARAERGQAAAVAAEPVTAPGQAPGQAPSELKPIAYTHTRRIELAERALRRGRVVTALDDAELAAPYKVLRTQVLHRLRVNNWNAVGVTSPTAGEGKTLTAVNLAVALAQEVNHTVLLVDLDLRRPGVHACLGFEPQLGLGDYLLQGAPLPEVLVNPGVDGLVILPGRERVAHSSEVLSSPRMVRLVEELKTRYPSRIVLFDLPPVLANDDALAFSPYVDAVLMVVRDGKTRSGELRQALEILGGSALIGTVLNDSDEHVPGYAYS